MKARGPRSEATRAILEFIRANAPVQQQKLIEHFRPEAVAACQSPASWMNSRLNNMRVAGWIEHGTRGWVVVDRLPQAATCAARQGRRSQPKHQVDHQGSVAEPRRISVMEGQYVPPATVQRAGSMDHEQRPSMVNGHLRTYRSGM